MYLKLLQILGQRSRCCGAKIITWAPQKQYCMSCEKWLRTDKAVQDMTELNAVSDRPNLVRLKLKQ